MHPAASSAKPVDSMVTEGNSPTPGLRADIAELLCIDLTGTLTIGSEGIQQDSFTAVTRDGRQMLVRLTDMNVSEEDMRSFLKWLCRTQGVLAFALGKWRDEPTDVHDRSVDIIASSGVAEVAAVLKIEKHGFNQTLLKTVYYSVRTPSQQTGAMFNLLIDNEPLSESVRKKFSDIWAFGLPTVRWRSW